MAVGRRPGRLGATTLRLLRFIAAHSLATGHCPSVRRMCAEMGWRSINAPTWHLRALEQAGLIVRLGAGPGEAHRFHLLGVRVTAKFDTGEHGARLRAALNQGAS